MRAQTQRLRLISLVTLVICVAVAGSHSFAEDAQGDSDASKRAQKLFEFGKKLYFAGEFGEAAKAFADSYALEKVPGSLFNQGRCLEEDGQLAAAISTFKLYVLAQPEGDATDEARSRIADLETRVASSAASPGIVADGTPRPRPGRNLRIAGAATAAAGIGLFAAGILVGVKARSIGSEFEGRDPGGWSDAEVDRFEQGERAETRSIVLLSLGAAAIAGGAITYVLGRRAGRTEVAPIIRSDMTGAALSLRF